MTNSDQWGPGIPEYGPSDLLTPGDTYAQCVKEIEKMLPDSHYGFGFTLIRGRNYPSLTEQKEPGGRLILLLLSKWPHIGHMSIPERYDFDSYCEENGLAGSVISMAVRPADAARAASGLFLKQDRFRFLTFGFLALAPELLEIPPVGTTEYLVHCLECAAYGYERGDFSHLIELLGDDCTWDSEWVLDTMRGRRVISRYLRGKGATLKRLLSFGQCTVVEPVGGMERIISAGKQVWPNPVGMVYPPPKAYLEIVQMLEEGPVTIVFAIGLEESGKISSISINHPGIYGDYEEYYRFRFSGEGEEADYDHTES